MIESDRHENIQSEEDLKEISQRIIRLREEFHKPVVATCDVHFLEPEDEV
jgi:DNA polymerase-3 subunit alpha (Gram-positive type)